MRASRLLSILLMLQTRGRLTADSLAATFEVSVRTVYRDIEQLSAAGVPVYADRGPGGGFQLLDGFRTKLTGLTENEAETLFLSGLPGPATQLGLADQLLSAQLKLSAALPERSRAGAHKIAQRFHLDPVDWFKSPDQARLLPALADAVWTETVIEVAYRRGATTATRRLHPLGLVLKAGIWYVVAETDGQVRTYRVARVKSATVTAERFERPEGFDLGAFWAESTAAYERDAARLEVVLRIDPNALGVLAELAGAQAVREAVPITPHEADPSGWQVLRLRMDWPSEVPSRLLALADSAEVLEPEEVRVKVATLAARLAARYGTDWAR